MNGIISVLVLFAFFETVFSVKSLDISEDGFCLPSQHSCNGIACIQEEKLCDGIEDCADGSDEGNCAPETVVCRKGSKLCKKTNGTRECLRLSNYKPELCTGCGAPPTIRHGNIILKNITENSAIGAWGKVMCIDGYESCASMIRCLPSGVWTTATCDPVPQDGNNTGNGGDGSDNNGEGSNGSAGSDTNSEESHGSSGSSAGKDNSSGKSHGSSAGKDNSSGKSHGSSGSKAGKGKGSGKNHGSSGSSAGKDKSSGKSRGSSGSSAGKDKSSGKKHGSSGSKTVGRDTSS